jgi:hypothetical protein
MLHVSLPMSEVLPFEVPRREISGFAHIERVHLQLHPLQAGQLAIAPAP